MVQQLRIALIGPTHSGKTTVATYLERHYEGSLIKIAKPLMDLQNHFYGLIGITVSGQDGELLQFLGAKIEKERPSWLCQNFLTRIEGCPSALIVNDDCRPNCYRHLQNAGFKFVFVRTSGANRARRSRGDHTPIDPSHHVEQGIDPSICGYTIENDGDLPDTYRQCDELIGKLR